MFFNNKGLFAHIVKNETIFILWTFFLIFLKVDVIFRGFLLLKQLIVGSRASKKAL